MWMISTTEGKKRRNLGFFEVGDRAARAVVSGK